MDMDRFKKFLIGSLIASPIIYFGCQQNEIQLFDSGNAKSIDAKIISKNTLERTDRLGMEFETIFESYSLITERNYNGQNVRDTTKIDVPDPHPFFISDYYKKHLPGYSSKTAAKFDEDGDLDKFLAVQDSTLKSLIPGRNIKLWVDNVDTTYHTILPDKIDLIQE